MKDERLAHEFTQAHVKYNVPSIVRILYFCTGQVPPPTARLNLETCSRGLRSFPLSIAAQPSNQKGLNNHVSVELVTSRDRGPSTQVVLRMTEKVEDV